MCNWAGFPVGRRSAVTDFSRSFGRSERAGTLSQGKRQVLCVMRLVDYAKMFQYITVEEVAGKGVVANIRSQTRLSLGVCRSQHFWFASEGFQFQGNHRGAVFLVHSVPGIWIP